MSPNKRAFRASDLIRSTLLANIMANMLAKLKRLRPRQASAIEIQSQQREFATPQTKLANEGVTNLARVLGGLGGLPREIEDGLHRRGHRLEPTVGGKDELVV